MKRIFKYKLEMDLLKIKCRCQFLSIIPFNVFIKFLTVWCLIKPFPLPLKHGCANTANYYIQCRDVVLGMLLQEWVIQAIFLCSNVLSKIIQQQVQALSTLHEKYIYKIKGQTQKCWQYFVSVSKAHLMLIKFASGFPYGRAGGAVNASVRCCDILLVASFPRLVFSQTFGSI